MKAKATTPTLFDVLPGEKLSVKEVMPTLSRMWSSAATPDDAYSPGEFHASQMNLVLHMGLQTSNEEALERFNTAVNLGKRCPCRIIVLCPMGRELSKELMVGKLFSECYLDPSLRSQCCCEAIMLGYPTRVAGFLGNHVSTWLESDLPTYHWFNRIPVERIRDLHLDFVKRCRRVIFDSSIEEDPQAFSEIPWPKPEAVIDLAWARILPVRQSLGQFFSSYQPASLVNELKSIEIMSAPGFDGEGANLMKWLEHCLLVCVEGDAKALAKVKKTLKPAQPGATLSLQLRYRDGRHLLWTLDNQTRCAQLTADLGRGRSVVPQRLELLEGERALTEAIFFA